MKKYSESGKEKDLRTTKYKKQKAVLQLELQIMLQYIVASHQNACFKINKKRLKY